MSDDKIELNRRRVLGGMVTLGGAAAAAGAGTFAYFSDTETSQGNQISSGTLNLTLNGGGSVTFTISNLKPGDSGYFALELANTGSVAGTLTNVKIGDVATDGSFNGANFVTKTDGTGSEFESGASGSTLELPDNLDVGSFIVTSTSFTNDGGALGHNPGSMFSSSSGTPTTIVSYPTSLRNALQNKGLAESLSSKKVLVFNYNLPDTGSPQNTLQGETVTFDFGFDLQQA